MKRDFSDLIARESEVEARWKAEDTEVVDLPGSITLCQEATGSRKNCNVCVIDGVGNITHTHLTAVPYEHWEKRSQET